MTAKVRWLGVARVGVDQKGHPVIDKDSIRNPARLAGDDDDDDDDLGDDDLGDDDLGEDEAGDDTEGDDDLGDAEGDEAGDELGGRRHKRRKGTHRSRRLHRKLDRIEKKLHDGKDGMHDGKPMLNTGYGNSATAAAAGDVSVSITVTDKFKAWDVTFSGSANIDGIKSITLNRTVVWSAGGNGLNPNDFGPTSLLRNLLGGRKMLAGQQIVINAHANAAGTLAANVYGQDLNPETCR